MWVDLLNGAVKKIGTAQHFWCTCCQTVCSQQKNQKRKTQVMKSTLKKTRANGIQNRNLCPSIHCFFINSCPIAYSGGTQTSTIYGNYDSAIKLPVGSSVDIQKKELCTNIYTKRYRFFVTSSHGVCSSLHEASKWREISCRSCCWFRQFFHFIFTNWNKTSDKKLKKTSKHEHDYSNRKQFQFSNQSRLLTPFSVGTRTCIETNLMKIVVTLFGLSQALCQLFKHQSFFLCFFYGGVVFSRFDGFIDLNCFVLCTEILWNQRRYCSYIHGIFRKQKSIIQIALDIVWLCDLSCLYLCCYLDYGSLIKKKSEMKEHKMRLVFQCLLKHLRLLSFYLRIKHFQKKPYILVVRSSVQIEKRKRPVTHSIISVWEMNSNR